MTVRVSATKNLDEKPIKVIDDSMSPYTVISTDEVLGINTTGGTVEILLPAASGEPAGRELVIYDLYRKFSTNACTITPDGTDILDGADDRVMRYIGQSAVIACNGVNGWNTAEYDQATPYLTSARMVTVAVAATDVGGGGTDSAFTAEVYSLDGAARAAAAEFKIMVADAQYEGKENQNANVTFSTATKGSIVASGSGWAVVQTDAAGEFACTAVNAANETVWFSACSVDGGNTATTNGVLVVGCVPDDATWS